MVDRHRSPEEPAAPAGDSVNEQPLLIDVPAHLGNEDENQRFTIPRAIRWVKAIAGVTEFDLDAAACEESHHAPTWYGWTSRHPIDGDLVRPPSGLTLVDGLKMPWFGDVFVNPPWDDIGPWVLRAWKAWGETLPAGYPSLISISMLLPGNRTHRPWWQDLVEPYRDGRRPGHEAQLSVRFAPERFPYGAPGNPLGVGVQEPNFTSVALVWRA